MRPLTPFGQSDRAALNTIVNTIVTRRLTSAECSEFNVGYAHRRGSAMRGTLASMVDSNVRAELRIATITVSDTRTESNDAGGKKLRDLVLAAGFVLGPYAIVKDEPEQIRAALEQCAQAKVDVVVLTGGTGIAPRDQTYEAIEGLLEKRLDGFGEAFRRLSWEQIGPKAILSRAVAGTWRGMIVAALPGSPAALSIGFTDVLAPVLTHAIGLLRAVPAKG